MKIVVGAIAVLVTATLSGCVSQTEITPTPTHAASSPTATPTPDPTPEEPQFTAVDPTLFFVSGPSDTWGSWDTDDVNFVSADGNLGCAILGAEKDFRWGCKIGTKTWEFSSASPDDFCFDSQVVCGQGIEVEGSGLPHPWQRSDPGFPATFGMDGFTDIIRTLNVGESVTFADVTCFAEEVDVRCENAVSGHGFVISETRNEIF